MPRHLAGLCAMRLLPLFIYLLVWEGMQGCNAQIIENDTLGANPGLLEIIDTNKSQIQYRVPGTGSETDTTIISADTLDIAPEKKDIETTINYSATDSIKLDVVDQVVYLYGDAKITYGDISLEAEQIQINWLTDILSANGVEDSTGKFQGTPIFQEGDDTYIAKRIKYNFKTRKGIISEIVTRQGEGYIHGEKVKKNEADEYYISQARYTTCNHEHPHFYINSKKIKMIPDDKIVTGPFNLVVSDIPTPLGFAFGIFPIPDKQTSGIIIPIYGESGTRGFFLRQGGYYWAVNDYIGIKFLGEIYTKGGWGLNMLTNYKKRYTYNGNLNLNFNKRRTGDESNINVINDFWVKWRHNPVSKGTGRFSASVDAGTSTHNRNNSYIIEDMQSSTFNSTISYTKSFKGTPFRMGVNLRQNQNTVTEEMNFTLPDFSFSMNRIYPFKKKTGGGKSWYEQINFTYNFNARYKISNIRKNIFVGLTVPETYQNDTTGISFDNIPLLLERGQYGAKHSIPLSTTFKLFKNINISPSINYTEYWYPQKLRYEWKDTILIVDTIPVFSRAYQYSAGAAMSTKIYGLYQFKGKKIKAIRHVMTPSIRFNYHPDFSEERFLVFYPEKQKDTIGNMKKLSRYQGAIFGAPRAGKSGSIGFSLVNVLEMKVKSEKDTTKKFKKVTLLRNLRISSSYNLAADSLNLAPFNLNATTSLFNRLNMNFKSTFDPYQLDASGNKINRFVWDEKGKGILRLTSASLFFSTNLNPKAFERKYKSDKGSEQELEEIKANPEQYVDFNIPWNLDITYNLNFKKDFVKDINGIILRDTTKISQSLKFSGDVNLTEKWKIGFDSGYDFINKGFSTTNITIYRDLHCWEMNFTWMPIGIRQSYSVDIKVKASILQDLKLTKKRDWYDR